MKIIEKKYCTGCGVCQLSCPVGAIGLEADSEGFLYPQINNDLCTQCNRCRKVCPPLNSQEVEQSREAPRAFGAHCSNPEIHRESSSGGIFSLIAQEVIVKGGVVVGAQFNSDFSVEHGVAESISELSKFRGAKYSQSNLGNCFQLVDEYLKQRRVVLFSGTPCQVEGLRAFIGRSEENLYCIDFICHGVPSPMIWKRYLDGLKNQYESGIERVEFRNKENGWLKYSLVVKFLNGDRYKKYFKEDLYLQGFIKNFFLRPSCYNCRFKGANRHSDITLADFWGIDKMQPELHHPMGVSLLLSQTQKGERLLNRCRENGAFFDVDLRRSLDENPSAERSAVSYSKRESFFNDILKGKDLFRVLYRHLKPPLWIQFKQAIRRLVK